MTPFWKRAYERDNQILETTNNAIRTLVDINNRNVEAINSAVAGILALEKRVAFLEQMLAETR
jgi:hypothetical protein